MPWNKIWDSVLFSRRGGFSTVKRAIQIETGESVAVKVISKNAGVTLEQLKYEMEIMRLVESCPQVISFYESFEDLESVYLVLELADGGNLLDMVLRRACQEHETALMMRSVLLAIAHCHDRGVLHRDMKPENLLISKDLSSVKLSDFGLATVLVKDQTASTTVGTRAYLSPEMILKEPYTQAVDMWSIGCVTYVLLCGYHPFSDDTDTPLYIQIVTGQWEFHEHMWSSITDGAKDFVSELLVLDPNSRMTARQALRHPWIRAVGSAPNSPREFVAFP